MMQTITCVLSARFARRAILIGAFALLSGTPLVPDARGGPFQLIDDNSIIDGDTSNVFDPQSVTNWFVDGVDQLFQQGFWYRVGGGPEIKVSSLPILLEGTTDTNFDLFDDTLFVRYGGAGFDLEIRLVLDGGALGSGSSDMGEQISITNTGGAPLDFHFFQYTDFELGGTPGGDTAVFTNPNTVRQFEGGFRLTETVVTPVASHREINTYPIILDNLNDAVATTLSDTPAVGTSFGPTDATWAFQWDVAIAPGATFQISKDKNLNAVPEPSTIAMAGLGLIGLAAFRRRRGRVRDLSVTTAPPVFSCVPQSESDILGGA